MAKIPERKSVKDKYKWNLCDLVNGDEAWEEKYNELSKKHRLCRNTKENSETTTFFWNF